MSEQTDAQFVAEMAKERMVKTGNGFAVSQERWDRLVLLAAQPTCVTLSDSMVRQMIGAAHGGTAMKVGLHLARQIATARAGFLEVRGWQETEARADEIRSRPSKDWKGKTVYAIRCHGTTGKGPHEMFVTEAVLWALIEPNAFICPFHA